MQNTGIKIFGMNFDRHYRYFFNRLKSTYFQASATQERCRVWGAIAVLGWMTLVSQIPPPSRNTQVWPYAFAFLSATAIAKTVNTHTKRAQQAKSESIGLLKQLRQCRTYSELENFHHSFRQFEIRNKRFTTFMAEKPKSERQLRFKKRFPFVLCVTRQHADFRV